MTLPYTQYGGIWKLNAASAAQGAGTWPSPPVPYLYSWGNGGVGRLGLGNTTSYSSPIQVGSLTNWLNLSASGYAFVLATKTDGTLWSWGQNTQGALGLGNTTSYSSPKQVGVSTNWSSSSCGQSHSMSIQQNGTLWNWGRNTFGQLGQGNTTNLSSPKQVGALTTWLSVSCGQYYTMALG